MNTWHAAGRIITRAPHDAATRAALPRYEYDTSPRCAANRCRDSHDTSPTTTTFGAITRLAALMPATRRLFRAGCLSPTA